MVQFLRKRHLFIFLIFLFLYLYLFIFIFFFNPYGNFFSFLMFCIVDFVPSFFFFFLLFWCTHFYLNLSDV